jgi:hypothetical protein
MDMFPQPKALLIAVLFCLTALPKVGVLKSQTLASSGLNAIIPLPSALRDFHQIELGVGIFGDNIFFVTNKVGLKYDINYTFLSGNGQLRDYLSIGFGPNFYFAEDGRIFRPFVGNTLGIDMAFGSFFMGVSAQTGFLLEIGDSFLLELSVRYRNSFSKNFNFSFVEPRIGLVINFDNF